MAYNLSPVCNDQQISSGGAPLSGGFVYTYLAGTSTPATTYSDNAGTAQTNPIVLNSLGFPTAGPIWLLGGQTYKLVVKDSAGVTQKTFDNIAGINDVSSVGSEWNLYSGTPTYTSATTFTLTGDQTNTFEVNRRIKTTNTGGTIYSTITTTAYSTGVTTITVVNDSGVLDSGLSAVYYSILDATSPSVPGQYTKQSDIAKQLATAVTTAGTAPAFTTTTTLGATTAYAANQRFRVKFNAAGTTGSNTLNRDGLGAKDLKQYDGGGNKVSASVVANQLCDIEYDGTDMVVLNPIAKNSSLPSVAASVATNALTVSIGAESLDFRSTTLTSGAPVMRSAGSTGSLVVPSGATLGTTNAVQARLVWGWLDNAGTLEPFIVNLAGGANLDETTLISTTAISGSSNSASVIYSTSARTNVAFRVRGFCDITEATAGTWATAPTLVQPVGGNALTASASIGYGQTWQDMTASRSSGTTYYNTTGKPIYISVYTNTATAVSAALYLDVNGVRVDYSYQSDATGNQICNVGAIVPPGNSYVTTIVFGSIGKWMELR